MTIELPGFLLLSTLAASVLAGVALLVGLFVRSPRLRHLLWLLVLARLVAPPIFELGLVPKPEFAHRTTQSGTASSAAVVPAVNGTPLDGRGLLHSAPIPAAGSSMASLSQTGRSADPPVWLLLWAGGGALLVLLYGFQWWRFSSSLDDLEPADARTLGRVRELAELLELRRIPRVWVSRVDRPPMVLPALGRPRILLPRRLIGSLTAEELDTVLAHELAHVRRRDHLVRVFEVVVMAFYWWLPVVWWARRELRTAEELCCDQAVLRVLPGSGGAYTRGIVKTLDFVRSRSGVPAMASGMSTFTRMEERLTMIMKPAHKTASLKRLPAAMIAVLALGVFPTFAERNTQADQQGQAATDSTQLADSARQLDVSRIEFERQALQFKQSQLEAEQQALSHRQDFEAGLIRYELDQLGDRAQELEVAGDAEAAAEVRAAMRQLEQKLKIGRARMELEREQFERVARGKLALQSQQLEIKALKAEGRHAEAEQRAEELMAARAALEAVALEAKRREQEFKARALEAHLEGMEAEQARLEAAGLADQAEEMAAEIEQIRFKQREMEIQHRYEAQQRAVRTELREAERLRERAVRERESRHLERRFLDQVRELRRLAERLPEETSVGRLLDELEVEAERLDAESGLSDPAAD